MVIGYYSIRMILPSYVIIAQVGVGIRSLCYFFKKGAFSTMEVLMGCESNLRHFVIGMCASYEILVTNGGDYCLHS